MWGAEFGKKGVGEEENELFSHLKHFHFSINGMGWNRDTKES